jgi:hypothetical protein
MDKTRPIDELAFLRGFLARLEAGELILSRSGVDVSQEEMAVLKREIAHLDRVLARTKLD